MEPPPAAPRPKTTVRAAAVPLASARSRVRGSVCAQQRESYEPVMREVFG
jgi:hypothetical protein